MVSARRLQFLVLACLASALPATADDNHLVIAPQSPMLEVGTNFSATCMIINTAEVTADHLYWELGSTTLPKEQYTRINSTALNVTVPITNKDRQWLFCCAKKKGSSYVEMNGGKFITGIRLDVGYHPKKPENLSCKAVQVGIRISPTIKCTWDSASLSTLSSPTTHTLFVRQVLANETTTATTSSNSAEVTLKLFPNFMPLEIWVEAKNKLGRVESDHLEHEANYFVETKPPLDVKAIAEERFPSSLLINWTHPIAKEHVEVRYQIRYCQSGSHKWSDVPQAETAGYIQSFRLQSLQPDTVYVVQVRCKHHKEDYGYWSNWSTNATERTAEDRPSGPPSLWRNFTEGGMSEEVQFLCKDPEFPNGKLTRFELRIQNKVRNESLEWESFPVNRSDSDSSSGQKKITLLKRISLANKEPVRVYVTAVNSVGKSLDASLGILPKGQEPPPVENLKVWPHEGQLVVEWKPPNKPPNNSAPRIATEYVVEWVSEGQTDWQKESKSTTRTTIKGNLEPFVCYNVSVYPLYSTWIGKPARMEVYLEQGAPSQGPTVTVTGKAGRNEAELVWEEIPLRSRQGFITNYTIYYSSGTKGHDATTVTAGIVSSDTTSYTLRSLSANTKYDAWIKASTIGGSRNGTKHSFATAKYAPGEVEGLVVGVSLGFMFVVLLIMLLCVYKRDLIKENFWPQIPNPGESTIGHWSPDYPLKAETPKENCLSGISVLDVDMCDAKCVFEEDKASLPLKKDKYLSEEHSSGIGGSSCMSSPRQSVSDSDEGGDMADTTSSTVQYSSVVASSGYKGQTPSSQPQQSIFSRSESTQPLLDSEENPDMLVQEGSRQSRHSPRQPSFTHSAVSKDTNDFNKLEMEQQGLESLDFCPLEEDTEQTTPTDELSADWLSSARASSYMPQLGGYRPQ